MDSNSLQRILPRRTRLDDKTAQKAGITNLHVDRSGNIVGVLPARNNFVDAIVLGSHKDTVERGVRFDGIVGVFGAL